MRDSIRSVVQAFFLDETPYAEMREAASPILRGLGIVVVIAVAVALFGLVGTALEWATTPKQDDIQAAVFEGIQNLPWYQMLQHEAGFREDFALWFNTWWRIFPQMFMPNVATSAAMIILLPLGLTIVWFLYGLASYLCARLMGGQGSLGQTLGCTALAVAPQLLNVATFFPYIVVGAVVGTWTLLCRYVALKTCHKLAWGRALAATLLPYVVFILVLSVFACMGSMIAAFLISKGGLR